MLEVALCRGLPPLRHVETQRLRQPFRMGETLAICTFVPLPDRVDRASGAIGQKIEPCGGVLRENPIPQAFTGAWQLPRPELMPFGEFDGGRTFLDAFRASRKRGIVERQSK